MLLILIAIVAVAAYVYRLYFKTSTTIVSGFNWTDKTIFVVAADKSIEVESSQMFSFEVKYRGDLIVGIEDDDGSIRDTKYQVGDTEGIILEVISNDAANQCVVQADVTNIYYDTGADEIKDIEVLSDKPKESFIKHSADSSNVWVYPGRYAKELLGDEINKDQIVNGIFFVSCANLDGEQKIRADILGSIYYDSNL